MAETFATALSHVPEAVLHGVASRSRARAGEFAVQCGIHHTYSSYAELLLDPAIDIVLYRHAQRIPSRRQPCRYQLRKSGALRETLRTERQRRVEGCGGSEAAGSFLQLEAMWMRFSPAVRAVLEIVRSNGIGPVGLVSAQLGVHVPFEPNHRVYAKPGGGSLYDFGVYPLSFTHALLGSPIRVRTQALIGPTGVDEQFTALLEYGSECQALVSASVRTTLANTAAIYGIDGQIDLIGGLYYPNGYEKRMVDAAVSTLRSGRPSMLIRLWRRLSRRLPGNPF